MANEEKEKLSDQLYRVVEKSGMHLANSSETEGRKRALLQDEDNKLKGPPELIEAEPVVKERTVVRTRFVEKAPTFWGTIKDQLAANISQKVPDMAQDLVQGAFDIWQESKAEKAREEQRKIAEIQRDAIEKKLELARLQEKEREAEERRQKEEALTNEQRQVINLSKSLSIAFNGYLTDMSKEDACKSLIRAFIYFILGIKEIQNIKNARIIDNETGEIVYGADVIYNIEWSEVLHNVNILLESNPSWLTNVQVAMLSDALGREVMQQGKYQRITPEELGGCLGRLTQ